ncbi:glucose-6-phosphate dehydrogenase [Buchnera aphidicola (Aphis helianthi)]|uniref:Glucose-6-phosphate 1-dehydrogenase n=1 Tax=Buchnera aphidicola (Aphis helianthi) TaxID=2315802 RepID=A0A4D6XTY6_9GAMM|nr:glucose-6-phosphate dehydrogenase [Buchnera aphidicola]QCI17141.1 glucose-6-phosphate dehydrogenase [Buchnera aphidicola (Aphis helianthi)]
MIKINQACDLIIFGAKGDLARRKLLPALYKLEKFNKIHSNTRIIGAGRANWTKEEYIKTVKTAIKNFLNEDINEDIWNKFSLRLHFFNIDVHKELYFIKLKKMLNKTKNVIIYYCAVPPSAFNAIFQGLGKVNLNLLPSRIIIEKPMGICLKTCKKINDQISKYFLESQIFRIDHYLGKESILNLFSLRFSNSFFFNNWNNKVIDHVQITVSEEVGIENRWNYFDEMGQTRDMVQNHLLQILTIIAMNQPRDILPENIRNEKIKILRTLKTINSENINTKTVRGQYTSGNINGKKVPAYIEENGANSTSQTETFVCIKVDLENDQWFGVPFYLRTGKRLAHKYSEIVIVFKKMPINLFTKYNYNLSQNKLIIRLDPNENIKINFLKNLPGLHETYKLENDIIQSHCSKKTNENKIDAYERLLLESMKGVQSLFVCREEVEEAWKWIDPIISAWKQSSKNTLQLYTAGTWGPKNSDKIIMQDGRHWNKFDLK